jgi:hypothetical protein
MVSQQKSLKPFWTFLLLFQTPPDIPILSKQPSELLSFYIFVCTHIVNNAKP